MYKALYLNANNEVCGLSANTNISSGKMLYVHDVSDDVEVKAHLITSEPSQPLNDPPDVNDNYTYSYLGIGYDKKAGRTASTFHYIGEWWWNPTRINAWKANEVISGNWYKEYHEDPWGVIYFLDDEIDEVMSSNWVYIPNGNYVTDLGGQIGRVTRWYYLYSKDHSLKPRNSETVDLPYLDSNYKTGNRYCWAPSSMGEIKTYTAISLEKYNS